MSFYRAGSTYVIEDSTIIAGSNVQGVYLSNNTGIETTNHKLTIKNSDISAGIGVYLSCTDATIDGESTKIEYTNTTGNSIYFGHDGDEGKSSGTVGSLTINGGEFVGPIGVEEPTGSAENKATISISGGEFDSPVNPDYLADGYIYQLLSDNMYTYYMTMEDALDAAKSGDIITDLDSNTDMDVFTVTVVPNNGQDATTTLVQEGGTYPIPAAPTRATCWFCRRARTAWTRKRRLARRVRGRALQLGGPFSRDAGGKRARQHPDPPLQAGRRAVFRAGAGLFGHPAPRTGKPRQQSLFHR